MRHKKFAMLGLSAALVVSLALVPRLARADVFFNQDIPISFIDYSQCTGEYIFFSGTLHVVYRETVDGSGGLHVGVHENYSDVPGVGLTSGAVYHAAGTLNEQFNFNSGGATTVTEGEHVSYVTSGGGNNLEVHLLFHLTINPDGTLTSYVDTFSIRCQ